jgi:hypothetical protein
MTSEDGSMTNSTLIARLMGPVLLIMGIGTALGLFGVGMAPGDYAGLMKEMTSLPFTILFGVLALLAGLAIVNAHNLWVSDWRVIITVVGWLAIIRGVLSLLFPAKMHTIGETITANTSGPVITALVFLVVGAILSWMGYRDLLR